ncbi:glycoside hydrolase family 16 protein [Planctomycetes bacterium K23_9]|uniref:Glucan endo-1,3-beta-glucosidase A1 n=1 Tax=Stieleria marina TaxID=1930275 RepID=A0A517NYY8_9BACT|nr:Glucan endo-1,3-beta-glucosidase A1 precursor [Planctomycetes bacterium K23_9]
MPIAKPFPVIAIPCWLAMAILTATCPAQDNQTPANILQHNTAESPATTRLVWHDEFDGESLDYGKWNIEVNAFGGGNHELQIYTDQSKNVRVENGHLVLETHQGRTDVNGTERDFSSGRVRTKHRGDWKYGRIEVRAKLPIGQGIWPAIWMLPTDDTYGGWANSGEIDIMEYKGQEPDVIWGTLHYGKRWPDNTHTGDTFKLAIGTFHDDFHLFAVDWREGKISWYVDNRLVQTQTKWSSHGHPFPAPFDQRFHLLLNLAVGGQFVGPTNDKTKFPQQFLIDYVRVYQ